MLSPSFNNTLPFLIYKALFTLHFPVLLSSLPFFLIYKLFASIFSFLCDFLKCSLFSFPLPFPLFLIHSWKPHLHDSNNSQRSHFQIPYCGLRFNVRIVGDAFGPQHWPILFHQLFAPKVLPRKLSAARILPRKRSFSFPKSQNGARRSHIPQGFPNPSWLCVRTGQQFVIVGKEIWRLSKVS